ncbi:MAG: hypothetical protein AMS23_09760 [Bacteroides sp. SM1_62]|jgi:hypothetical protein|nr:MAG: hypothetical protein AMS26_10240 [Bacteroides sp. SM23_62]KPL21150.1 MAG: hypothetical protein AMS23_09760 [Bacteroides sp. SM1_62]
MLLKFITWLESHQGTCSFREHAGIDCPGCGLQRSILALLKGDLVESILQFPALLPLMAMFIFLGLHLVFKLKNGALVLKLFYITNISIIVLHYIYKLIIH